MEDKRLLLNYLSSLEDSLRRIRSMDFSFDQILGDEDVQDLIGRRMQKAIEACIDIAIHLAVILKLPRKERISEIFGLLTKHKIMDSELAGKLKSAIGFRNILAHEYTEIDYQLAYSNLEAKLTDLERFAYHVRDFLNKSQ